MRPNPDRRISYGPIETISEGTPRGFVDRLTKQLQPLFIVLPDEFDANHDVEGPPKELDGRDIYALRSDQTDGLKVDFGMDGGRRMYIFKRPSESKCTWQIRVGRKECDERERFCHELRRARLLLRARLEAGTRMEGEGGEGEILVWYNCNFC